MSSFTPGQIIQTFTNKQGKKVTVRLPKKEDATALTEYINTISKEDTFITFSGEQVTERDEVEWLENQMQKMESGDAVVLLCTVDGEIVGNAAVTRSTKNRKRSAHIGEFGISITKEFRGTGIGYILAQTVLEEAKTRIPGLKLFCLNVYSPNEVGYRLYKKLGFEEYGRFPEAVLYKDEYVDQIEMYKEV